MATKWQDTWADLFVEADAAKERAKEDFLKSIGSPTVLPLDKVALLADKMTAAAYRALLNHIGPVSSDESVIIDTAIVNGVKKLDLRVVPNGSQPEIFTDLAFKTGAAVNFRTEDFRALYSTEAPPHYYTIGGKVFQVQNQVAYAPTGGQPWLTGPGSPGGRGGALRWNDNTWTVFPIVQAPLLGLGVPDLSKVSEVWVFVEFVPPAGDSGGFQKLIFGLADAPTIYGGSDLLFKMTKVGYNGGRVYSTTQGIMEAYTGSKLTPTRVDTDTVMAMRILPDCVELYSGVPWSAGVDAYLCESSFSSLRAQMKRLGVLTPSVTDRCTSASASWADGHTPSVFLTSDANRVGEDGPAWRALRVDYLESGLVGAAVSGSMSKTFETVTSSEGLAVLSVVKRSVKLSGTEDLLGLSTTGLVEGDEEIVYFTQARTVKHAGTVSGGYAPFALEGGQDITLTAKTMFRFKLIDDDGLVWRQIGAFA